MAYWWVSQNKTYRYERAGGYLWAPVRDQSGRTPQHWRTMLDVQPGDVIFSYVGQTPTEAAAGQRAGCRRPQPPEAAGSDFASGRSWHGGASVRSAQILKIF